DHADTSHRPKAHRSDNDAIGLRHKDTFLLRIVPEAVERFRRPGAHFVDSGVFAEGGLLNLEQGCEISFGGWSDTNHKRRVRVANHLAKVKIAEADADVPSHLPIRGKARPTIQFRIKQVQKPPR